MQGCPSGSSLSSFDGAHSLRIGGATALAWLQVPGDMIQAAGRWHSVGRLDEDDEA